jgi:integrase
MSWSIARIKHPEYPNITVRVGEFEAGGILFAFRWVNGKQTSRSLRCRRRDLGSTLKGQEKEARRLACEYIDALVNAPMDVERTDCTAGSSPNKGATLGLTIRALADKYELDGFAKSTAAYKRDALATIRHVASFLEPNLLVRDIKPSHVEKYLASRIAAKHAPAGRADLIALSICCNWAVGEGILDTNPTAIKRAPDAMKIDHEPKQPWFSREEFDKLKAVAHQLPASFGVLLDLAWGTGRRISAIVGLRWADIMFKPEEAWTKCKELDTRPENDWLIEDFVHGGIRWYAGRAPNKKRRDYVSPMPVEVKAALMLWKKQTLSIGGSRFVFVAPNDATKALERHVAKKWLKKAEGFAKLTHQAQSGWHAFRRGWATKRKNFPIKDLARAGGWGKGSLTPLRNYQQSDRETASAVINA